MTVLILSLSVPIIVSSPSSTTGQLEGELARSLIGLEGNVVSYILSFAILGTLWARHHNMFYFVARVDRSLLWLNLLFLLTIGFIPFSTALLGRYYTLQIPVVLYGANLALSGIAMQFIWQHINKQKLMVGGSADERTMNRINRRLILGPVIYVLGIVFSWWNVDVSIAIYIVVLLFNVFAGTLGFWPGRDGRMAGSKSQETY